MKKLMLCLLCVVFLIGCAQTPVRTITQGYEDFDKSYKTDDPVALLVYDETLVSTSVTDDLDKAEDHVTVLVKDIGSRVEFFAIYSTGRNSFHMIPEVKHAVNVEKNTVIRLGVRDLGYQIMWYLQVTTPDGEVYGSPIPYACETTEKVYCVGKNWDGKDRFSAEWEEVATEKPVIYFYPQEECQIDVQLDYAGELTCTYPVYQNGWSVTARPDGTLIDAAGMEYQYLYWEGEGYKNFDFSEGFCVPGKDTAAFLEVALEKLGLNRREANEFIIYWLPRMQNNPYNVIAFQTETYEEAAKLHITPEPDTLLRVFMAWYGTKTPVDLPAQELTAPVREGFTVVEWGGAEMAHP